MIINPLYAAIAGGVLAIGLAGTIRYQSSEIHKYHTLVTCVQTGISCPTGKEIITVPQLQAEITLMRQAQMNQTKTTEKNIPAVKPKPEVITIIKR
jgi:hypothetical protein